MKILFWLLYQSFKIKIYISLTRGKKKLVKEIVDEIFIEQNKIELIGYSDLTWNGNIEKQELSRWRP